MGGEVAEADVSAELELRERRGDDVGRQVELFDQGVQRPATTTANGVQQPRTDAVRRPTLGRRLVAAGRKLCETVLADERMVFGMTKAKLALGVAAELELTIAEELVVSRAKQQAVATRVQAAFALSDNMMHVHIAAAVAPGHAAAVAGNPRCAVVVYMPNHSFAVPHKEAVPGASSHKAPAVFLDSVRLFAHSET